MSDNNKTDSDPAVNKLDEVSGGGKLSRRDILKMAAATITGAITVPIVSSCGKSKPAPAPTPIPSPTPDYPQGEINAPDVPILGQPGDESALIAILQTGALIYIISRDKSDEWYEVRTEGNVQGWIKKERVTVKTAFISQINAVPIRQDVSPFPTAKVEVEVEVEPGGSSGNPVVVPTRRPQVPSSSHYWYPN